ncbi:MAG: hypothetical protein M3R44_07005 [Candidatus Eremiobacteraeota bacterium]|nr:hypothetical protein [Candidatus Eremiobacteraeota bacterium]
MKRVSGLVFVCAAASSLVTGAVASAPTTHLKTRAPEKSTAKVAIHHLIVHHPALAELAPGDEYFGPLGQSVIGINNTMRDTGRRYDVNHDIGPQTFKSVELTETAIRAWAKKYPQDDQLPRAIYFLQRLYTKVLYQPSRDRAHMVALWLFHSFAASPQAKQLKKTLAVEHLAAIPPLATPAPLYNSVFGSAYPSEFTAHQAPPQRKIAAPAATSTPMPLPTGSAAPNPIAPPQLSPSPSPRPSASRH